MLLGKDPKLKLSIRFQHESLRGYTQQARTSRTLWYVFPQNPNFGHNALALIIWFHQFQPLFCALYTMVSVVRCDGIINQISLPPLYLNSTFPAPTHAVPVGNGNQEQCGLAIHIYLWEGYSCRINPPSLSANTSDINAWELWVTRSIHTSRFLTIAFGPYNDRSVCSVSVLRSQARSVLECEAPRLVSERWIAPHNRFLRWLVDITSGMRFGSNLHPRSDFHIGWLG